MNTAVRPEKLTLDTCLVRDYFEHRPGEASIFRLIELYKEGAVDLAITEYVQDELGSLPRAAEWLAQLPVLGVSEVPIAFEVGKGRLDRNPIGNDRFTIFYLLAVKLARQRLSSHKRGKYVDDRDWGHLQAHLLAGRDVFLTSDEGILCLAPELREQFRLEVMRPEDYLHTRPTDSSSGYLAI